MDMNLYVRYAARNTAKPMLNPKKGNGQRGDIANLEKGRWLIFSTISLIKEYREAGVMDRLTKNGKLPRREMQLIARIKPRQAALTPQPNGSIFAGFITFIALCVVNNSLLTNLQSITSSRSAKVVLVLFGTFSRSVRLVTAARELKKLTTEKPCQTG